MHNYPNYAHLFAKSAYIIKINERKFSYAKAAHGPPFQVASPIHLP